MRNTPYAHALDRMVDAEDDLIAALNEEQKALLQLYSKAHGALDAIIRREEFAAGFQVGARIMLAVLEEAPATTHHDAKA